MQPESRVLDKHRLCPHTPEGGREAEKEGGREGLRPCCTCCKEDRNAWSCSASVSQHIQQTGERHRASVALKTEIRAMRLLVLASNVVLFCS